MGLPSKVELQSSRQPTQDVLDGSNARPEVRGTCSTKSIRRKGTELPERHHPSRQRLLELREFVAEHVARTNALLFVEPIASARMAHIVAYAFQMRRCRGIMYFQTPQEAQNAANSLRQTGLDVSFQSERGDPAKTASAKIIVRITGTYVRQPPDRLRYILHATRPRSLEGYLADLTVSRKTTPPPISTILFPRDAGSGAPDVDSYCRSRTCRYAHLVRRSRPTLIEPRPHLFRCNCCDVCISHPFGMHEEEHRQVVSV